MYRHADRTLRDSRACVSCLPFPSLVDHPRTVLKQTAHINWQKRYEPMLTCFSSQLKADAALHWASETLMRVPFLKRGAVEDDFLAALALALKPKLFAKTEYISVESLLIVERGVALRNGHVHAKGACLGEDMVLGSLTFRDLSPAVGLSAVIMTSCLDRDTLDDIVTDYPLASKAMRSFAFKIAFRRAIVQVSREITNSDPTSANDIGEAFTNIGKAKQLEILKNKSIIESRRKMLAQTIQRAIARNTPTTSSTRNNNDDEKELLVAATAPPNISTERGRLLEERLDSLEAELQGLRSAQEAANQRLFAGQERLLESLQALQAKHTMWPSKGASPSHSPSHSPLTSPSSPAGGSAGPGATRPRSSRSVSHEGVRVHC